MKKLLIAAVAVSAAFAAPAMAQTSVNVPLSGTLASKCNISAFLNGPFDALNLESTLVQGSESLTVNCNYTGTASVTFDSANDGVLKSGSNTVPYKFILTGVGGPLSTGVSLASNQTVSNFSAVANADQTRSMRVQLDAIATVAGTYTDTVTVSVAPN